MADRDGAPPDMIALGAVVNTHGIRGELRMLPHNPETEAVGGGVEITLSRGGHRRTATVRSARRHKRFLLLTIEGVDSMSAAEALIGCEVEVPASTLPPAGEGEIYHFQLIGLTVVTDAGETLGVVEEVFSTPAHDICVVHGGGREYLVPYVEEILREVDVAGGRLVIAPTPGLLEPE